MEADFDSDSDSGSDYLSFEESDDDEETKEEKEARERERRMVLEAAGLIVQVDVKPPPALVRARSLKKTGSIRVKTREVSEATIGPGDAMMSEHEKEKKQRRAPPAIPITPLTPTQPGVTDPVSDPHTPTTSTATEPSSATAPPRPPRRKKGKRSMSTTSSVKDLPPLPLNNDASVSPPSTSPVRTAFDPDEHARQLDDAFERYESFRNANLGGNHTGNRLSVVSAASTDTSSLYPPPSPTDKESVDTPVHRRRSLSNLSSHFPGLHTHGQGKTNEAGSGTPTSKYSHFLQFLGVGRSSTPEEGNGSGRKLIISGPIPINGSGEGESLSNSGGEQRSASPAFGSVSFCPKESQLVG